MKKTTPAVGITSASFVYVPAAVTDIRKTFDRALPNWFVAGARLTTAEWLPRKGKKQ